MRMSVCFLPGSIKETYFSNVSQYRFVNPINTLISLSKKDAYDVICYLLAACFNLNAFGYNKKINEFWGKKLNKEKCFLQFNLQMNEIDINTTNILITPIVGTNCEFNKFIQSFNVCISIYNKSHV